MTAPSASATHPASTSAPLAALRRLEWRVRHAVETSLGGGYRSAFRGRGMEFDQVVRYAYGDDVRDIDWNVTARLGEPYRKKFVEEREVTVLLVVEDTPSLQFGSGDITKRDALLELAGFLLLLASVNRDRVGLAHLRPDGPVLTPPVHGRGPIHHLAARLFAAEPPPLAAPQFSGLKSPPFSLSALTALVPRHTIVVWLSDHPARPVPEGWAALTRRCTVLGLRIDDPWDRAFPENAAGLTAYDPLSGQLVPLAAGQAERRAHAR
ncbi:MAG: DUF58 domain-containing protein, partial [Burkholderiales bacterium]|nr:DUF58 domain-containing protein [Opitutaceae bacterium]